MTTNPDRISFRLSKQDQHFLSIVAGRLQWDRKTPFVSPADAIRAALAMAAEKIASQATATGTPL